MPQLENIEAIEKRLWKSADTLRSNSNYASNEYFMPVMGLIFLRHAYSRFLAVKDDIVASLPTRGGKPRPLSKEDFSQRSAIFLRKKAQFDYLVNLTDDDNRANAIVEAMQSIEKDYRSLKDVLPKSEYQELDNEVLGKILRDLNPDELKKADGDVFGRIYEYFLTQFADQKAHDGGEFFTPVSLVSFISHVIEPTEGIVLDPACGSAGMFVQCAHFLERLHANPNEKLTFFGLEKNPTTIRLAKMNLAVHGLEGSIQKAISYYEDPHELIGKANYVMANPPFNVDEVDADKVKRDPRLPFGIPGKNKEGKVSNGNYLWISYFYSYLNDKGRAGFVMSSQASSAGRDEAKVRQKLVETGDVDCMVAIRPNFFYTRTVPCELWFLNKDKSAAHKDKVLMLDARNIYRKVTRKIYDFSPEQLQNLLSVVWLYRGENQRFLDLVSSHLGQMLEEARNTFEYEASDGSRIDLLCTLSDSIATFTATSKSFIESLDSDNEAFAELGKEHAAFSTGLKAFEKSAKQEATAFSKQANAAPALRATVERLATLAESSRGLVKAADLLYKLVARVIEECETMHSAKESDLWSGRDMAKLRKTIDSQRQQLVDQLKQIRYFHKQAAWLTERFPDGVYCDVDGLVKLVDRTAIEAADWSLTPGRYVGVAPEEEDDDFDFEEALRDIHIELEGLNDEAVDLAAKIKKNFEELGV